MNFGMTKRASPPVVEAEADDSANMVDGDFGVALECGQSACGFVSGHVTADAVNVQQGADLADGDLELAVHADVVDARRRRRQPPPQLHLRLLGRCAECVWVLRAGRDEEALAQVFAV